MNGLMNASVSLGSSHFAARVTWSPHVSVPSGAATAGPAMAASNSTTIGTSFMAVPRILAEINVPNRRSERAGLYSCPQRRSSIEPAQDRPRRRRGRIRQADRDPRPPGAARGRARARRAARARGRRVDLRLGRPPVGWDDPGVGAGVAAHRPRPRDDGHRRRLRSGATRGLHRSASERGRPPPVDARVLWPVPRVPRSAHADAVPAQEAVHAHQLRALPLPRRRFRAVLLRVPALGPRARSGRRAGRPRGADVVLELSGAPYAFAEGLDFLRPGGRYAVVGQLGGPLTPVQAALFVRKQATVLGVQSADIGQFWKALEFVRRTASRYDFGAMLTTRYPLDRINEAIQSMRAFREIKPLVLPWAER